MAKTAPAPTTDAPTMRGRIDDAWSTMRELAQSAPVRAILRRLDSMSPRGAFLLGAALVAFGASVYAPGANAAPTGAPVVPAGCLEDMPCWNWVDGGNGARGVILVTAPRSCRWRDGWSARCVTVLSACEYFHARRAGVIDRARTASLKGDRWARDHGCDA